MKKLYKLALVLATSTLLSSCGFSFDVSNVDFEFFNFDAGSVFVPKDMASETIQVGKYLCWSPKEGAAAYNVTFFDGSNQNVSEYITDTYLDLTPYFGTYKQARVTAFTSDAYFNEGSYSMMNVYDMVSIVEVKIIENNIEYYSSINESPWFVVKKDVDALRLDSKSVTKEIKINARSKDLHIYLEDSILNSAAKQYSPALSYGYKTPFNLYIHVKGNNSISSNGIYNALSGLSNVIFIDEGGSLTIKGGNSLSEKETQSGNYDPDKYSESGMGVDADIIINTLKNGKLSLIGGNGSLATSFNEGSNASLPFRESARVFGTHSGLKIKCGDSGVNYYDSWGYVKHYAGKTYTFDYLINNQYKTYASRLISGGIPTGDNIDNNNDAARSI